MEGDKLTTKQFELFRDFIYRQSGMYVDASKITLVSNRIRSRLKAGGFKDFVTYYNHLVSPKGASEVEQFIEAISTNESYFFRTNSHFEWFKHAFLGEMIARHIRGEHPPTLRIWSAACSAGEEAYSLAICLTENSLRLRGWKLYLLGTDISQGVLEIAKRGVYRKRSIEGVDETRVRRNFDISKDGQSWTIKSKIQEMVEFRQHNLMKPMGVPQFDCIFVRNVLIYFDRASRKVAIRHLIAQLAPGGYLVVGPSEGVFDMLAPLRKLSTFLYQKPEK